MALGTQLQLIVEMVRDEARLSSATSQGIDHLQQIKRLIRRTHIMLADSYEWAHLKLAMGNAVLLSAATSSSTPFQQRSTLIDRLLCICT